MKSHYDPEFKPAFHRRIIPGTKAIARWDGWAGFISQLIIAFGFLIFGLTHFAFASSGPRDSYRGADSQMIRSVPISVNGTLSWSDGVGKIQDMSSGRSYVLENADGLKALWESGVRKVALVGHLDVNGAISVEDVSTP